MKWKKLGLIGLGLAMSIIPLEYKTNFLRNESKSIERIYYNQVKKESLKGDFNHFIEIITDYANAYNDFHGKNTTISKEEYSKIKKKMIYWEIEKIPEINLWVSPLESIEAFEEKEFIEQFTKNKIDIIGENYETEHIFLDYNETGTNLVTLENLPLNNPLSYYIMDQILVYNNDLVNLLEENRFSLEDLENISIKDMKKIAKSVHDDINKEKLKRREQKNFNFQWDYFKDDYVDEINDFQLKGKNINLENLIENMENIFGKKLHDPKYIKDYFDAEEKVVIISKSKVDDNKICITTGNITEKYNEIYNDEERHLKYQVRLFEQDKRTYDEIINNEDALGFWYIDTAYLNINKVKEYSEIVKNLHFGPEKEIFNKIKERLEKQCKKNNTSFEEEFIKMIKETTIKKHEPLHFFLDDEKLIDEIELKNTPKKYREWVLYVD